MFNHLSLNINKNYFLTREQHPYHLVETSQLPIITASLAMVLVASISLYFHPVNSFSLRLFDNSTFQLGWLIFVGVLFCWFLTVVWESGRGFHTIAVRIGLRLGMILFIVSEVMFFFAFFWAFFHVSLAPSIAIGGIWPPRSIQVLDVWGLPFVNTTLLLSSGIAITLAHRALLQGTTSSWLGQFDKDLLVTIILGVSFLCCQAIEYKYGVTFRWKENIYGSTFFVTTGFHGLHVTIGTIFLLFCLLRTLVISSYIWDPQLRTHAFLKNFFQNIRKIYFEEGLLPWFRRVFNVPSSEVPVIAELKVVRDVASKTAFTKEQHLGFEAAAWYWHFVDVVWIFLFITIYWWGS